MSDLRLVPFPPTPSSADLRQRIRERLTQLTAGDLEIVETIVASFQRAEFDDHLPQLRVSFETLSHQLTWVQRLAEAYVADPPTPFEREQTAAAHVVRQAKGLRKALRIWVGATTPH